MSNLNGSTLSGQRDQSRDIKQEPNNTKARATNSGTKVANGQAGLNNKSFSQQMAELNAKGDNGRNKQKINQQNFDPSIELTKEEFAKLPDDLKNLYIKERQKKSQQQQRISSNNAEANPDEAEAMEQSHKKMGQRLQDSQKAMQQSQNQRMVQRQEMDEDAVYESKQESMADTAQDKQAQVNQAGNAQQQQLSPEEQRKQQLAQWEILAPRILEDGKNKAIRLDIPDVHDIKTIIVKMHGNSVDIQAIGSRDLVKIFKTKEGILRSTLAKKNVRMGSTRVIDFEKMFG
ncbi:MAG: hypothetical protein HRT47_08755 [Candidatus Caenarcaniphilales bacterium]|nr:hypothetical protein [Candidatus Caenarcaniphilales bacterium]